MLSICILEIVNHHKLISKEVCVRHDLQGSSFIMNSCSLLIAMQEEALKLVLLALEDGSALSRKVLVLFVVQRLEPRFPQASKTSIGHVVQLLYRASCFKVSSKQPSKHCMPGMGVTWSRGSRNKRDKGDFNFCIYCICYIVDVYGCAWV